MASLGDTPFYVGLYKRSLSKTTEFILAKFGRKHLYGMGIPICANQVAENLLGPSSLDDFFSRTARPISTKIGRKYSWVMGIQIV